MPELIEDLARQIQEKNREAEKNLKGSGVDRATIAQKTRLTDLPTAAGIRGS